MVNAIYALRFAAGRIAKVLLHGMALDIKYFVHSINHDAICNKITDVDNKY